MPEGVGYGPQYTASTGLELNYIGNHAYAYSGTVQATQSDATLLEFTTGNKLIIGEITCAGAVDNTNSETGCITAWTLTMNAVEIIRMKTETLQEDMPPYTTTPILIPAYTSIKLVVLSNATVGACSAMIIGKVHQ